MRVIVGYFASCKQCRPKVPVVTYRYYTSTYTVKKVIVFLVPSRERMVSDIPAGDGKIDKLFYSVSIEGSEL
jgi:hypothetical protein